MIVFENRVLVVTFQHTGAKLNMRQKYLQWSNEKGVFPKTRNDLLNPRRRHSQDPWSHHAEGAGLESPRFWIFLCFHFPLSKLLHHTTVSTPALGHRHSRCCNRRRYKRLTVTTPKSICGVISVSGVLSVGRVHLALYPSLKRRL